MTGIMERDLEQPESFEFTAENMETAKWHISKYPDGRQASAVMPLLDLAQRQIGWVPKVAMDYIAELLDIPPIRVYEVATFYTMYNKRPIGKHHVQVCTNLPCWLRGSDAIVKAMEDKYGVKMGETTEDGTFTFSEVECLCACVNAPMMQIDDHFYEDLDSESAVEVLEELAAGKMPREGSRIGRYRCEPIGGLTSLGDQEPLRSQRLEEAGKKSGGGA